MTNIDRKPTMLAYFVSEKLNERRRRKWVLIGYAWPRASGNGFSVRLDQLPQNGRIEVVNMKKFDKKV